MIDYWKKRHWGNGTSELNLKVNLTCNSNCNCKEIYSSHKFTWIDRIQKPYECVTCGLKISGLTYDCPWDYCWSDVVCEKILLLNVLK